MSVPLRAWDTLVIMKLCRREVVSSIPDRCTKVGQVYSPTRQLIRFSHLNVTFFQNSEFIWKIVPLGKCHELFVGLRSFCLIYLLVDSVYDNCMYVFVMPSTLTW